MRRFVVVLFVAALGAPGSAGAREQEDGASAAQADESRSAPTILLIRTPGDDGVMGQLRAELSATKWDIVELRLDERRGVSPLAELAERQQARAAVRVDRQRGRIELLVQQEGGAVTEVLVAEGRGIDDRVLALRTTEALRARGLDLDPVSAMGGGAGEAEPVAGESAKAQAAVVEERDPAAPAPARVPAPDHSEPAARGPARLRQVWLGAGPGVVTSPGGVGNQLVGSLDLSAELGTTM